MTYPFFPHSMTAIVCEEQSKMDEKISSHIVDCEQLKLDFSGRVVFKRETEIEMVHRRIFDRFAIYRSIVQYAFSSLREKC